MEFGSNIGLNLKAINRLLPNVELAAIEINKNAAETLKAWGKARVYNQSLLDFDIDSPRDLVLSKGVLIHLDPQYLDVVYEKLFHSSKKYILIAEYYNPTPMEVSYRGHTDKLYKRDYAGEMLDKFSQLKLVDYGFVYHKDNNFPQDDITWFLLKK